MNNITVLAGRNKVGENETFDRIDIVISELVAIVGNTGSGKSRFIMDIEQLVCGDSVSGRQVIIDGKIIDKAKRQDFKLIAHLSQSMRFMLDASVEEFILLHSKCRDKIADVEKVLSFANSITKEPIFKTDNLNLLSGGQTRALMVADIALISDSPIVLIDEIENAGIDKILALKMLCNSEKIVLIVTHDPHTALMADRRIVMKCGGVSKILARTAKEKTLYKLLDAEYKRMIARQEILREGGEVL